MNLSRGPILLFALLFGSCASTHGSEAMLDAAPDSREAIDAAIDDAGTTDATLLDAGSPLDGGDAGFAYDWVPESVGAGSGLFGGAALTAIWGSSATDIYVVGGDWVMMGGSGRSVPAIFHSSGTGDWEMQTLRRPDGGTPEFHDTYYLRGIWGSSATDIYAVGENGLILHSTGDGTWTTQGLAVFQLNDVWGSSATDIYAVGEDGAIYHSAGDGVWYLEDSHASAELRSVWGSGAGDVYVGGHGGLILHSNGDGNWLVQTTSVTADIDSIWGSGATNIYAAARQVLHSSGDGTWTAESATPDQFFHGLWGSDATDVFAVSIYQPAPGYFGIYHAVGDGSWTPLTTGVGSSVSLFRVWGSGPADDVYAVGNDGLLIRYRR